MGRDWCSLCDNLRPRPAICSTIFPNHLCPTWSKASLFTGSPPPSTWARGGGRKNPQGSSEDLDCRQPYLSWVEALPRALRIYHDAIDPATNLSPYQVVFGRHRNDAGLPWEPEMVCEGADEFLARTSEVDTWLAERLNHIHERIARRRNKKEAPENI